MRDRGVLPLADAVRKVTRLPAQRLGLSNRGILEEGAQADIVVFDAERIASRCSLERPRLYATGIAHVLVNGRPVMRDGERMDENPGRVLRRT